MREREGERGRGEEDNEREGGREREGKRGREEESEKEGWREREGGGRKRVREREGGREDESEREGGSEGENSELYYTRIKILGSCLFLQSVLANLHAKRAREREREKIEKGEKREGGGGR